MTKDRIRVLVFIAVTLISGGVFFYTMSPTVAFWDCGEFIAASYVLGVPHPPGTPLYIVLGRVFSLVPIGSVAQRVTFMSVLFGALSCGFMYLVIERIMKKVSSAGSYVRHFSASVGALVGGFSFSVWFSSVEAEVYSMSGFVMVLMVWLALVWGDRFREGSHSTWRWVMLLAYVGALSVGVHLEPVLVLAGLFIYALWVSWGREESRDLIMTFLFLMFALLFSYLLIKLHVEHVGAGYYVPVFMGLCGVLFVYFAYRWTRRFSFRRVIGVSLLVAVGLSCYMYLMVRAHLDPPINESDPRSLSGLWEVFSRKQYGENNPFNRRIAYPEMWNNGEDLGFSNLDAFVHDTRIFFHYFAWQYTPFARDGGGSGMVSLWVTMIYIALGLVGLVRLRDAGRREFAMLFITFLLLSAGLIFYLNMRFIPSDPSYLRPQEVRERDYFYGSAYQWWGVFVAFGLMWLAEAVALSMRRGRVMGKVVCSVIGVLLAVIPIFGNWRSRANRYGDWMADDYGYNILISCSRPGILFTNGDNDTFPLWFQQEVLGTRKYDSEADTGVIVANFSLLNTNWYIKQIHMQGFPLPIEQPFRQTSVETDWIETFIDRTKDVQILRKAAQESDERLQFVLDSIAVSRGKTIFKDYVIQFISPVPTTDGGYLLPKDIALRALVCGAHDIEMKMEMLTMPETTFARVVAPLLKDNTKFSIYFSTTCTRENRASLDPYLQQEALVYRVTPEAKKFDREYTIDMIYNKFRYRGLVHKDFLNSDGTMNVGKMIQKDSIYLDDEVFLDDNAIGLSSSYASMCFNLGMEIGGEKNPESVKEALMLMKIGRIFGSFDPGPFAYQISVLYKNLGEYDKALREIKNIVPEIKNNIARAEATGNEIAYQRNMSTLAEFYSQMMSLYIMKKEPDSARIMLDSLTSVYPRHPSVGAAILILPLLKGDTAEADSILFMLIGDPSTHAMIVEWANRIALDEIADSSFYRYIIGRAYGMGIEESLLIQTAKLLGFAEDED